MRHPDSSVKAAFEIRHFPDTETIMADTGLHGPHALTKDAIDKAVVGVGPGAYVLTREGATPSFIVNYAGRSDDDLNGRLQDWIGTKYTHFKFGFLPTPKDAFLKECNIFHDFGGITKLDNKVHPARPANSKANCPVAECDALQ
jgi:hypothetical protein